MAIGNLLRGIKAHGRYSMAYWEVDCIGLVASGSAYGMAWCLASFTDGDWYRPRTLAFPYQDL